MTPRLDGKRVAIVAGDGAELVEFTGPRDTVSAAGAQVDLLSIEPLEIQARNHDLEPAATIEVGRVVGDVPITDYDALVLPGGTNPDKLRLDARAVRFAHEFAISGRPVAAIRHGPWTLSEAGVVSGMTVTSYPSIPTDLHHAGAKVVDRELALDENMITSRSPADLDAFCAALVEAVGQTS